MRVFAHDHAPGSDDLTSGVKLELATLPRVGDYILTHPETNDYLKVLMLVHTPFGGEIDAEVFGVMVNPLDERRRLGVTGRHTIGSHKF